MLRRLRQKRRPRQLAALGSLVDSFQHAAFVAQNPQTVAISRYVPKDLLPVPKFGGQVKSRIEVSY